jgi:fumarylacetoacetase
MQKAAFPDPEPALRRVRRSGSESFRAGVAIGDQVLDLPAAQAAGAFSGFDEATRTAAQRPAAAAV